MTDTSTEATLKKIPYIWHLVWVYQKNDEDKDKDIRALIDSGSKVNTMDAAYTTKLSLRAKKIDVGAPKLDRSHLDIFGIVIADCSVKDKLRRVRFFKKPSCWLILA